MATPRSGLVDNNGVKQQKKKKWDIRKLFLVLMVCSSSLIIFNLVAMMRSFSVSSLPDMTNGVGMQEKQQHKNKKLEKEAEQISRKAVQAPDSSLQKKTIQKTVVIGYAISLIKCSDFHSSTAGLMDAALVLRHSVHLTSSRNSESGSEFDYKMYALVHRQAEECSSVLEHVGFEVIVVDPPIQPDEIQQSEFLRAHIHREWCCGHDEFIKLYAYTHIPHSIVVHVDIDFLFLKPMDELFRAMLYDKDSVKGKEARNQIAMERPKEHTLPDRIDAFVTKDWPQVLPGRKAGFQAGFLVLRPSKDTYEEIVDTIRIGNYTEGYGRDNGWGGMGYGAFVGAMAMQGLMAYYYDVVNPHNVVELNQCRFNWMGMDTRYNASPNFQARFGRTGDCRNDRKDCEDCRRTPLKDIKSVHFTQCRKPWNCIGEGTKENTARGLIDARAGNVTKCLEVLRQWHEMRTDFEDKFFELTNDDGILQGRTGKYMPNVFMGHCNELKKTGYNPINATTESFKQLPKLYEL